MRAQTNFPHATRIHRTNTLKQNSIKTVPEQYQTTPKTDSKTMPNPTNNEKTKRNTHTMGHRGGQTLSTRRRARGYFVYKASFTFSFRNSNLTSSN